MNSYVVCISDASSADRAISVIAPEEAPPGKIAQMALDDFVSSFGDEIRYPLFIDLHPAAEFAGVRWLHLHVPPG